MNRFCYSSLIATLICSCIGCSSFPRRFQNANNTPAPVLLPENPTFEDVARVVNSNSARIQQLQVTRATLTTPDSPALKASYALERPRRFRLTAETTFTGQEIDLGSNDDDYWVWIRRDPRRAVYFGAHDQFYQSGIRDILPVPPHWLIEAIGVVELDPTGSHSEPSANRPGQLEIRSRVPTPNGELTKITVIDDRHGWVLEQQLYDEAAGNQLLASAMGSDFKYDPSSGVSLPHTVDIRLPPANLEFTLRTDEFSINQLYADPAVLWAMPQPSGFEMVDVSRLSSPAPRYVQPTANARYNRSRPIYRQGMRRLPALIR